MRSFFNLAMLSLLTAFSVVQWASATLSSKNFITNFDNIKTDPLGDLVALPVPYDDLQFGGLLARNDGLNILRSHSPPNSAGSSNLSKVLSGSPPANITTKYTGSKVKYFHLISTYLGCSIATSGSVPVGSPPMLPTIQVPQPCQISFAGTNSKGQPISQDCSYSGTAANPAMQQCFFSPSFGDVVTLILTVSSSLTVPLSTVLVLDNVSYTDYLGS